MAKQDTSSLNEVHNDQDPIYKPISKENPCGKDLRYTTLYDEIKLARSAEDSTLPQGIWKHKVKSSDYKKVADLSYKALCEQSKDIQLMAWLIEAWVVSFGAEGLLQGFTTLKKMLKDFWPTIYPQIGDSSDPSMRLAPLRWINEKLPEKISFHIPLAPKTKNHSIPLTLAAYIQEQTIEKKIRKSQNPTSEKEKYKRQKEYTLDDYEKRLQDASPEYYKDLNDNLKKIQETLLAIEAYLHEQLPNNSFSFSKIKKLFRKYETVIQPYIANFQSSTKQNTAPTKEKTDTDEEKTDSLGIPSSNLITTKKDKISDKKLSEKKITSSSFLSIETLPEVTSSTDYRGQAYTQLKKIGDYLLKVDPHSPASYLLQKSISWSTLSLEDIFLELQEQSVDLKEFMSWLGMKKKS
mgnify:CR=1 FL=1